MWKTETRQPEDRCCALLEAVAIGTRAASSSNPWGLPKCESKSIMQPRAVHHNSLPQGPCAKCERRKPQRYSKLRSAHCTQRELASASVEAAVCPDPGSCEAESLTRTGGLLTLVRQPDTARAARFAYPAESHTNARTWPSSQDCLPSQCSADARLL